MLTKLKTNFLQLLFPITCSSCGTGLPKDDYFRLCRACCSKIKFIEGLYCKKCGVALPDGGAHCFNCKNKKNYHFEFIRASCHYEGIVRDLIHKFKYFNKDYLDRILGRFLIRTIETEPLFKNIDIVVPVPMHFIKRFFRGYNQAELLAKVVSKYLNKPIITKLLYRKRITKSQFKLSKNSRIDNLKNCFALRDNNIIKDKTILLIDDVCTTAATIEECSKALIKGHPSKIYGLTVAKD